MTFSFSRTDPFAGEIPLRPAFELRAAGVWYLSAALASVAQFWSDLPSLSFYAVIGAGVAMGTVRLTQGVPVYRRRKRIQTQAFDFLTLEQLFKLRKSNQLFLGWGYSWTPEVANTAYEVLRRDPDELGLTQVGQGATWLQGLAVEKPLYSPISTFANHTMLPGTTRVGKTRLMELLSTQLAFIGPNDSTKKSLLQKAESHDYHAIIVIDPKGDPVWRDNMRRACALSGDESRFVNFDVAHPNESACIDVFHNWSRPTELASRVANLIPSETKGDPFMAFSWKAMADIISCMVQARLRPNLVRLKRYIEGGPGPLLRRALMSHFESCHPNYTDQLAEYVSRAKGPSADRAILGAVAFYQEIVSVHSPSTPLDGLISQYNHESSHFSKMVSSLYPVLSMLTSGALSTLLSPTPDNSMGRRVTDMKTIITKGQVVVLSLDGMSDPITCSALGSMFVSDLVAVAGDRYNELRRGSDVQRKVHLFCDEVSDSANPSLTSMMNKSSGSGFSIYLAFQAMADLVDRLGSEAAAERMLGNANNMISHRVKSGDTMRRLAEDSFPEIPIRAFDRSYVTQTRSLGAEEHRAGVSEGMTREAAPIFPQTLLGQLPPLSNIGRLSDGMLLKGRIPIIQEPD